MSKGMFSLRNLVSGTKGPKPPKTTAIHGKGKTPTIVITQKKSKDRIPSALREQVWIKQMGRVFEGKCMTTWCQNTMTTFDFESGHNIPESKGGPTTIDNLVPICRRCNGSMGNTYTFDEWCAKFSGVPRSEIPIQIVTSPSLSALAEPLSPMPIEEGTQTAAPQGGVFKRMFSCFSASAASSASAANDTSHASSASGTSSAENRF